jgi:NAD(P)-dependent dehydrogenase (short-subunit alcohol dehydrogenase family)
MPTPQVWLVTGSSRGLGLALAQAVLAEGHRLVATARNPEHLADLARRYGETSVAKMLARMTQTQES